MIIDIDIDIDKLDSVISCLVVAILIYSSRIMPAILAIYQSNDGVRQGWYVLDYAIACPLIEMGCLRHCTYEEFQYCFAAIRNIIRFNPNINRRSILMRNILKRSLIEDYGIYHLARSLQITLSFIISDDVS